MLALSLAFALCGQSSSFADQLARLKLHIYRSLGISATQDPTTGEFSRAVVRKSPLLDTSDGSGDGGRGDVNIINVDGKLTRAFYTRMFWDAL